MNELGIADLTGVRAKLGRAKEHLGVLNSELTRLTEQHAETKFIQFGHAGDWHTVSIGPIFEFPPQLSLVAGDFFNNIRAALDHLVWQLVLREGKEPKTTNEFPIFYSREEFINKVKSLPKKFEERSPLYGIPVDGDAWTLIERAQPWFNCKFDGLQPKEDILATIALLSNIDKHRTLLVSQPFPDQTTFRAVIGWNPINVEPIEQRFFPLVALSHKNPTELMRLRFPNNVNVSMHVNGRLPIGILFGDEKIQRGGLGVIFCRVNQIIEQFSGLPRVNG